MASQSPPPLPADAEVVRNIEVLAAFVAKTGPQFEQLARVNTAGDPKFGFLLGDSPPGSEAARSHAFYQWKKQRLEQRVFATDGSDDLQLKICAMVDDARTPPKILSSEKHARILEVADEVKPPPLGAAKTEANAGALQKTEPSKLINSDFKPDHPLVHRAKGDIKRLNSTIPPKRKAESITASSITKKGMPHEDQLGMPQSHFQEAKDKQALSTAESQKAALSAASQEQNRRANQLGQGTRDTPITGDRNRIKMVIAERALKAKFSKEDSPSDGVAWDVSVEQQLAEATEKQCKESLGLRLLKSTLADYVKEELKPAWKEGNMSKEAFKSIVKKVVDKVVGSLQAHQIPKSQENVDQYMAQSEAKISKLVQGYVDRFKKS